MNHRITPERRKNGTSVPLRPKPCSSRNTQSRVPRAISRQLWKISKEEKAQPMGSLHQCSVTHTALKDFWCSEETSCVPVPMILFEIRKQKRVNRLQTIVMYCLRNHLLIYFLSSYKPQYTSVVTLSVVYYCLSAN